jgi:hypothetical protein
MNWCYVKQESQSCWSKAQREYFNHPSPHPAKNAGFAQDDHFLCAASKHIISQNSFLRNIS